MEKHQSQQIFWPSECMLAGWVGEWGGWNVWGTINKSHRTADQKRSDGFSLNYCFTDLAAHARAQYVNMHTQCIHSSMHAVKINSVITAVAHKKYNVQTQAPPEENRDHMGWCMNITPLLRSSHVSFNAIRISWVLDMQERMKSVDFRHVPFIVIHVTYGHSLLKSKSPAFVCFLYYVTWYFFLYICATIYMKNS